MLQFAVELLQLIGEATTSEAGKAVLASFQESRGPYLESIQAVLALARENKDDEARRLLLGPLRQSQAEYFKRIDAIIDLQSEAAKKATAQAQAENAQARTLLITLALGAIAASVGLASWITRSITRPVFGAMDACKRIAAGDLAAKVPEGSKDEIGQLLTSLASMQSSLSQVVAAVRSNSESVATASAQIAQGNQDLSQRTEEQASARSEEHTSELQSH